MPAMPDPSDVAVLEPIWLVEATYAPDAAKTRVPFRAEHLAGIVARLDAGTYIEAACGSRSGLGGSDGSLARAPDLSRRPPRIPCGRRAVDLRPARGPARVGGSAVAIRDVVGRPGLDPKAGDIGWRAKEDDVVERFDEQPARVDCLSDRGEVPVHDGTVDDAFGSSGVLGVDLRRPQVEDDRDHGDAGRLGSLQQAPTVLRSGVRCVDDRRLALRETAIEVCIEDVERGRGRSLVGRIPGDRGAQGVRGEDLTRREQAGRQRGFPGASCADEHNQARIGQDER